MSVYEKNSISGVIWLLGWALLLGGIIGSLICGKVFETLEGYYYRHFEYNWTVAILGSVGSVILSCTMFGLSYIIDYLEIIANSTLKNNTDKVSDNKDEKTISDKTSDNYEEKQVDAVLEDEKPI